ncbi:MAG: tRNA (guanosine(37)-N1)-methyltransferase TrmD [Candidatus Melainabacteria bacterium]|nr:MAG: tRNA (guanosine(37)-N1)-methyltransferase TrmD [Candidatus Melainabacteria bacterium]
MLTFHVITLFPELIETYCATSIIGRGVKAGRIAVKTYNPRDFCEDKYRKVDDTPYGGGVGMVLKPEPFYAALESIQRADGSPVCMLTPQGQTFSQNMAETLAKVQDIVLICGHYEGFDERIRCAATLEISIGDFVVTGGELPALTVLDAVGRLIPGVLGKLDSATDESFNNSLLEAPQYTKPSEFRGMVVPEVLRSGDHKAITLWRRQQALKRTLERRPDLLEHANLDARDREFLNELNDKK